MGQWLITDVSVSDIHFSFGCCWLLALSCSGLSTFGQRGSVRGAGSEFYP